MIELSITVKDENSKLTIKDIIYGSYELSNNNQDLCNRVEQVIKKHQMPLYEEAPDVIVSAKMVWQ